MKDILCERNHAGNLVLSAIVEGHRIHRVYIGYSKAYAKKDFKKYINDQRHAN